MTNSNGGTANAAQVVTEQGAGGSRDREERAEALESAANDVRVKYENEKHKERKAALRAAWKAAQAEAKQARAEARKGSE